MIASPTIRRRMAGCIALMENPEKGEAEAARAMLAKLEKKYGPYVAESTISRGGRTASDFGQWSHKAKGFWDGPPVHFNCRSSAPSDAKGVQPWHDADMADLANECAGWLWSSGWYCEISDGGGIRWNICPEAEYENWIKYGISNAELIQFAHQKGFGVVQLGESGDRLTQFNQAIAAPEFDAAKAKPGERAPRKNFDPSKAPDKKGNIN